MYAKVYVAPGSTCKATAQPDTTLPAPRFDVKLELDSDTLVITLITAEVRDKFMDQLQRVYDQLEATQTRPAR